jgi:hypothetical protein
MCVISADGWGSGSGSCGIHRWSLPDEDLCVNEWITLVVTSQIFPKFLLAFFIITTTTTIEGKSVRQQPEWISFFEGLTLLSFVSSLKVGLL